MSFIYVGLNRSSPLLGVDLILKSFSLGGVTMPEHTGLPFAATLSKRSHFLILGWTGVGQITF